MGKRIAEFEEPQGEAPPDRKRTKTETDAQIEEIFSARQLQDALAFRQDDIQRLRNGIQTFKAFLEKIHYKTDEQLYGGQVAILRDYLEAARSKESSRDAMLMPDLMQAWDFAYQTNNDSLVSAISSVLALLLRTLSSLVDLRDLGTVLCRALLQVQQCRLISRGLSASKHKEHLISPCLRMLTDLVSFDGGSMAYQVYQRREFTLESRIMARNLSLYKPLEEQDRRKPAVRTNAVRYLLSLLRYQTENLRVEILLNAHLLRPLFQHLLEDPTEVFVDIIKGIETWVLGSDEIPRHHKTAILSERSLASLLAVARNTDQQAGGEESQEPVNESSKHSAAMSFLERACTLPKYGLLQAHSWYSRPDSMDSGGGDEEEPESDSDFGDGFDRYQGRSTEAEVPRNKILAAFLQTLKPHSSLEERQLTLSVFEAAPGLVAHYVNGQKDKVSLDPKLTNTWLGYASFYFSLMDRPVPTFFGSPTGFQSSPPPTWTMIENVLPQPLSGKVATRCLNQSSTLISLFAVRAMLVGFRNLRDVLAMLPSSAAENSATLNAAKARLVSAFVQRCPSLKDVISLFRRLGEQQKLLRESVLHLISLYFTMLPDTAATEQFDVSVALYTALERASKSSATERTSEHQETDHIDGLELQHLLVIAQNSAGMRWWQKPASSQYSPFTTLLSLSASGTGAFTGHLEALLQSIVQENGILQQKTSTPALRALLASLATHSEWAPSPSTLGFLDECTGRLIRKPIKYMDDLDGLRHTDSLQQSSEPAPISLLVLVCLEQIPFTSRMAPKEQLNILTWIKQLLSLLAKIGEDVAILDIVRAKLQEQDTAVPEISTRFVQSARLQDAEKMTEYLPKAVAAAEQDSLKGSRSQVEFKDPPVEKDTHTELQRWKTKGVEECLDDGIVADLMFCLCSRYPEIRKQALAVLSQLNSMLPTSGLEEKEQISLVLAETIETARDTITAKPLPYIGGAFAVHALMVQRDAKHIMYPKVNRYLMRSPSWNVSKLPEYWLDKTLLEVPKEDHTSRRELEWVLDMFVDGIRTPMDLKIHRHRDTFERLMILAASPSTSTTIQNKIAQFIYRALAIEGSSLLVTGCGILSWLETQIGAAKIGEATLTTLVQRISNSADVEKVDTWSGGRATKDLKELERTAAAR